MSQMKVNPAVARSPAPPAHPARRCVAHVEEVQSGRVLIFFRAKEIKTNATRPLASPVGARPPRGAGRHRHRSNAGMRWINFHSHSTSNIADHSFIKEGILLALTRFD